MRLPAVASHAPDLPVHIFWTHPFSVLDFQKGKYTVTSNAPRLSTRLTVLDGH